MYLLLKKKSQKTTAEIHEEREAKQTINYHVFCFFFFFETHIKTKQKKAGKDTLSQPGKEIKL